MFGFVISTISQKFCLELSLRAQDRGQLRKISILGRRVEKKSRFPLLSRNAVSPDTFPASKILSTQNVFSQLENSRMPALTRDKAVIRAGRPYTCAMRTIDSSSEPKLNRRTTLDIQVFETLKLPKFSKFGIGICGVEHAVGMCGGVHRG